MIEGAGERRYPMKKDIPSKESSTAREGQKNDKKIAEEAVENFYRKASKRPSVRELLKRLAK